MDFFISDVFFLTMEHTQYTQYMYHNDRFYFRFIVPNIAPGYWYELSKEYMLNGMKRECKKKLHELKHAFLHSLNGQSSNVHEILNQHKKQQNRILRYYDASNYEVYKRDLVRGMYSSDNCIVSNPGGL